MNAINSKQRKHLEQFITKNALAQAYHFCGPAGTGKKAIVVDFISKVNRISNKDLLLKNRHPDVIFVEPEIESKGEKLRKKDISIAQVRDAMEKAQYYPYQSRFKFVVINEAETMTSPASNSLLKFLEEPANDTIICLISNNEQRVLPTIRSRCQPLRFGLQPAEKIENELRAAYPHKQDRQISECAKFSRGRIDYALNFCSDDELIEKVKGHQDAFRKALRGGLLEGISLSEKLFKDQNALLLIMEEWIWFLRDFLKELIAKKEDARVVKKVFAILASLVRLKSKIEYQNTNTKIQLDNFFVQLS